MRPFIKLFALRMLNLSTLCIWGLATIVMAIAGPFGTYASHTALERLVFWGSIIGWSFIVAAIVMALVPKIKRINSDIQREIVSGLLFTILFSPTLWIGLALYSGNISELPSPLSLLAINLLIVAVIASVRFALIRELNKGLQSEPTEEPQTFRPRLMDRLPDAEPGAILRISADNHMVTVVTDKDSYELRMRLSDAVAEMEGVEGYLTHRSHWIAKDAIVALERENGKTFVISQDEQKVPVSRKNLSIVREAVSV